MCRKPGTVGGGRGRALPLPSSYASFTHYKGLGWEILLCQPIHAIQTPFLHVAFQKFSTNKSYVPINSHNTALCLEIKKLDLGKDPEKRRGGKRNTIPPSSPPPILNPANTKHRNINVGAYCNFPLGCWACVPLPFPCTRTRTHTQHLDQMHTDN